MTHEEFVKKTVESVKRIKEKYRGGVIKNSRISNIGNRIIGEYTGVHVIFELSTKYDYTDNELNEWKNCLNADNFYIRVKLNQLHIHYNLHNYEKV